MITHKAKLTGNLVHRASEPFPGTQQPEAHAISDDNANGHDSIVQCLIIDRVLLRKNESDTDERNPETSENRDGIREWA